MTFHRQITPLIADPKTLRAARIYPGGSNLDRIVGQKTDREPGWHYPEAWVFSPVPAINPGSRRNDEGLTRIFDADGNSHPWKEFLDAYGDGVTGPSGLNVMVKLLDGAITLPKEFHFRPEDENALRALESVKSLYGKITKPEIWIRHPGVDSDSGPSFLGFRERTTPGELLAASREGVEALERLMNRVSIPPWSGLYLPGGIVHSLGSGLYFEVLADGDLKVTLQNEFAGKKLSEEEQLGVLFTGSKDDMVHALEFVSYGQYGQEVIAACERSPVQVDPFTRSLIRCPYFEVDWVTVPAGLSVELENVSDRRPRIIVAATGLGEIKSELSSFELAPVGSTFDQFANGAPCLAAVVHHETSLFRLTNTGKEPFSVLHVREPWRGDSNEICRD